MNKKARSRKFTAKQSARLGAYFATGVAASVAAPSEAEAAIVFFDVNPDQTFNISDTLSFGSINLGAGTYSLNGTSGTTFELYFDGYTGGLVGYLRPRGNVEWGFSGSYVDRLALNDSISAGSSSSWGATPVAYLFGGYAAGLAGNWGFSANETQSGFAPLRIDAGGGNYNYGWVEVTVVSGNTFSAPYLGTVDVTVTGFAFENTVNTAINAGDQGGGPAPVPEPGTMAVGAGLFALAVGAHLRRRREKKAAASDALLNLAAGACGVEKLRADNAG